MRRTLPRLARNTRAAAAAITGLVATLIMAGGAALTIDYRWYADQRDSMQGAVEAAALSLGRDTHERQRKVNLEPYTDAELTDNATKIILAHLVHLDGDRLQNAIDTLNVEVKRTISGPTVTATIDLGGTLLAQHFLGTDNKVDDRTTWGHASARCSELTMEIVFSIDMSTSMGSMLGSERRIDAAADTAMDLIDDITTACPDADLRFGIVPWNGTVALPNNSGASWVDQSAFAGTGYEWGGCVESNQDPNDTKDELFARIVRNTPPTAGSVRAYFNRDTATLTVPATLVQNYYVPVLKNVMGFTDTDTPTPIERFNARWADTVLPLGSNHWGGTVVHNPGGIGGPNLGCTPVAMLPLTKNATAARDTLKLLKNTTGPDLIRGHTHVYLGVIWSERMLDPAWHSVWAAQHPQAAPKDPEFPSNHVRAIVLLTDGDNYVDDTWGSLPGNTKFVADSVAPQGWRTTEGNGQKVSGHTDRPPYFLSLYSALGRIGSMGLYPHARRGSAETRNEWQIKNPIWTDVQDPFTNGLLNELMLRACRQAQTGATPIDIYGVALQTSTHVFELMRECTGDAAKGTNLRTYQPNSKQGLRRAFADIARGVIRVSG